MKSIFTTFTAGLSTSLALVAISQAAPLSNATTTAPSCGIPGRTDDSSYFSVVGVQGTGVHLRQELRELAKDTETWNLFLQAFARFQAMDQSDKVSYFEVAGIHGVPFREWDGVKGDGIAGYCPHNSNLFGSWHRPYLALFEQVLQSHAVKIAEEYPAGEARKNAQKVAEKIRLPYWDWAMNPPNADEGVMPAVLRQPTASITYPNGTKGSIPNPIYQYNFHPLKYEDFSILAEFEFKDWNTTIRSPLDGYAADATSRNDETNKRVTAQQPNNRDTLYKLLTTYQPWNQWSTKADGGEIGSVETIHDGVHNSFGLGNMGIVEASSYDPVFWFHHCNMDRIMTLYQSRYPDLWVEDAPQAMETYTMKRDSVQGPDSVLAPFHMNAKGDMWTSSLTRNWTSLGYTYPELVDSPSNDTLTRTINKLYKSTTQGGLKNTNNNDTISTLSLGTGPDATDWLALVKMPADIKISYSVRAFLGTPDADPKNWPTDPNYVGQIASLSSPRMSSTTILTGHISLTNKLAAKFASGDLKSLDKSAVTDWLKTNFHWRIQALDFTEIPREHPPKGLNVTVFSVPVHLPHSETDVPVWAGALEYKPEIVGNPPESKGPDYSGKTGRFDEGKGTWEWNMTDVTEREKVVSSSRAEEEARASPTAKPVPVAGPVSLGVGASASASAGVSGSAGSSSLPAAASSSSAVQAGGDRSSPVTQAPATSSASPTPSAPGQSVVLETLGNGEVVTKIVTVVVPVTVYA